MTNSLLPEGTDRIGPDAPIRRRVLSTVRDEFGVEGLTQRLTLGPRDAGVDLVVLATKASVMHLHSLISRRQGVRTLIAVLPPRPADARTETYRIREAAHPVTERHIRAHDRGP